MHPATDANAVSKVRNDAKYYLDWFLQAMYPDRIGTGNGDDEFAGKIETISKWIHNLRIDGKGTTGFPELEDNDTKTAWKDMVEGKTKSGPYQGPLYTVRSVAETVITAASDSQKVFSQARSAERWLYGVLYFDSECPPPDWKPSSP